MLLEPLSRLLTSRGITQSPLSCSQTIRLLMVSCRGCMRTQHSDTKKVIPLLASLKMDFLEAVRRNDVYMAQCLRQKLREACSERDLMWVHNAIINMHARRREPELAFAVAEEIRPRLDSFSYAGLLNACAKAQHPPYDLPEQYARLAQQVFEEMVTNGIVPSTVHYHTLMDCQAKAGKSEEAIGTSKAMQQGGLPPTTWTLNILLSACARARQPHQAREIMEDLISQGVKSDVMTWNTLLTAFARAKHIDGAYQVWQQMQQSGVTPDRFTQRALSEAFAGNVALAAQIVQEADWLQRKMGKSSNEAASSSGEDGQGVGGKLRVHHGADLSGSDAADPMTATVSRPFLLNLHGLSQSAARIALVQRLDFLTFAHIQHTLPKVNHRSREEQHGDFGGYSKQARDGESRQRRASSSQDSPDEEASGIAVQDLEIVVGQGKRSHGMSVLRDAAVEILTSKGIVFQQHSNKGRLVVPSDALRTYVLAQKESEYKSRFFHMASMQYVVVGLACRRVLSAIYIVPLILDHAL